MENADTPITTAQLKERRSRMMAATHRAILRNKAVYCQIRSMLCRITCGQVDIGDYYGLASTLAKLLESMGPGTLFFQYYPENIHPEKKGKAHFLRAECQDLLFQLDSLQEWRKEGRVLHLIPGGKPGLDEA